jgi:hypothetical protein
MEIRGRDESMPNPFSRPYNMCPQAVVATAVISHGATPQTSDEYIIW